MGTMSWKDLSEEEQLGGDRIELIELSLVLIKDVLLDVTDQESKVVSCQKRLQHSFLY
jgi:hypothetical protein